MIPFTLTRFPVPDTLKYPYSIKLGPPCFTVGMVLFALVASPLLSQSLELCAGLDSKVADQENAKVC